MENGEELIKREKEVLEKNEEILILNKRVRKGLSEIESLEKQVKHMAFEMQNLRRKNSRLEKNETNTLKKEFAGLEKRLKKEQNALNEKTDQLKVNNKP